MSLLEKLKARYGVGLWGVLAILLTFALAGMTVVRIRNPILDLILPEGSGAWVRWVVYPLLIFPIYQIALLTYGAILGQFSFFWEKEKAIGRWLIKTLTRSSSRDQM